MTFWKKKKQKSYKTTSQHGTECFCSTTNCLIDWCCSLAQKKTILNTKKRDRTNFVGKKWLDIKKKKLNFSIGLLTQTNCDGWETQWGTPPSKTLNRHTMIQISKRNKIKYPFPSNCHTEWYPIMIMIIAYVTFTTITSSRLLESVVSIIQFRFNLYTSLSLSLSLSLIFSFCFCLSVL